MHPRKRVIRAILRRELASYFATPIGYVFITLFVFLSAMAAFWQERFFATNLANLDQLNRFFPYLLIFLVPAISMSLWAEEKKQGTEELLLTLPATDLQIVLGKYLAALAIYSVALLFSLSHVVVLCWLGSPDPGLMFSTYLGYWLMGAALLTAGMLASALTDNLTVAFILGAVFCSVPVFLNYAGAIVAGVPQRLAEKLSVVEQFRDLSTGVITLGPLVYFASFAAATLYLNVVILGHRRWRTGPKTPSMRAHLAARALALAVIVASLTLLASNSRLRLDATSEQIHSLSAETKALLRSIDRRQPVFIQAYFSPDVPRSYVDARSGLVAMLREFQAVSDGGVNARIVETVKYSPQAREAQERFGIKPFRVPASEESARRDERNLPGAGLYPRLRGVRDSILRSRPAGGIRADAVHPRGVARQTQEDRHPEYTRQAVRRTRFSEPRAVSGVVHRFRIAQAIRSRTSPARCRLSRGSGCAAGGAALVTDAATGRPAHGLCRAWQAHAATGRSHAGLRSGSGPAGACL